ncbi:MAG: SPOR domain-containing protein [Acetobacteraceae bacterium]|nr:SPOR domain-containing protein [Acetobacteraceae bacterium]
MRMLLLLCALAGLSGCGLGGGGGPRYVIGAPYQAGGLWRYPAEDFTLTETGLAIVTSRGGATANGESFDSANLAASHRTLQLPAIARLTNLENGRQVVVRINDRGPADPARLIGVTRRVAELLAAANPQAIRVRLQVLEAESRQLAAELQGQPAPGRASPPPVQVAAAPRGGVQAEALAPPTGTAAGRQRSAAAAPVAAATTAAPAAAAIPLRLAEQVTQASPRPGQLAIECGAFAGTQAAEIMRARLAGFGARMLADYNAPRDRSVVVRIGPLATLAQAEGTLRRVLPAGCLDGRIVIE